jgi:hypothetical protein
MKRLSVISQSFSPLTGMGLQTNPNHGVLYWFVFAALQLLLSLCCWLVFGCYGQNNGCKTKGSDPAEVAASCVRVAALALITLGTSRNKLYRRMICGDGKYRLVDSLTGIVEIELLNDKSVLFQTFKCISNGTRSKPGASNDIFVRLRTSALQKAENCDT